MVKDDSITYDFSSVVMVNHVEKRIRLGNLLYGADVLEAQSFERAVIKEITTTIITRDHLDAGDEDDERDKKQNMLQQQRLHIWSHIFNIFNPFIAPLKPQSNGPSYSNTVTVTFGTARRGLGGATARPGPSSLCQM